MLGVYGAALLPGLWWPSYLDTAAGVLIAAPYLSLYLFDMLGVPGLLQNGGACGWGWCRPTWIGSIFTATVWLGVAWLAARGIAYMLAGRADSE